MLTLALLPPIDDWVYIVVYTIYAITILGTIVIIITENRNPVKSLAWVLVLAFLPIVGLVFYIFFGQNFKAKRMVSRRIKRKLRKRDYHSIVNIDSLPLSEESKQEIRLCHSLCSVPYYSGSHVKIFTSGEDKFKHYLQDLEIAQEYIHIQYYIFEDDKLGNRVKEVLLRCARRGIQIRILYDDVGCWSVKKRFFKEMQDAGIGMIMDAGSTILSWDKIVKLTEEYPFVYGAIGVHPDEVGNLDETQFARMERLLDKEKIKAVGEIGLDYYWDKENHDLQKEWFIRQLDLARKKEKPVIIHSREAAADTMEIMEEYASGLRGVIHCYSYSAEMAKEYVKMGYYIGIGGVVTFKNAKKLKQVVQEIPLESIVLETDCPYLAPVPYRGKRNSSLYLPYVAEEIAELKGAVAEDVVLQTEENARKLYGL